MREPSGTLADPRSHSTRRPPPLRDSERTRTVGGSISGRGASDRPTRTVISAGSGVASFSASVKSPLMMAPPSRTAPLSSRTMRTFSGPTISALSDASSFSTTPPRSRTSVPSSFLMRDQSVRSRNTA
jgi:hypothetical protein